MSTISSILVVYLLSTQPLLNPPDPFNNYIRDPEKTLNDVLEHYTKMRDERTKLIKELREKAEEKHKHGEVDKKSLDTYLSFLDEQERFSRDLADMVKQGLEIQPPSSETSPICYLQCKMIPPKTQRID
jgi:hypothetical protein